MALVSYALPNLIGGVSQQPPSLRLPETHEAVTNTWPSIISGLQKRPGTDIVAKLGSAISGSVAGHTYSDPVSGQTFFIVVDDNDIKVFNEEGDAKTVNGSLAGSYLDFSGNAENDCRMLTIGDTTFILNREITAETQAVSEDGSRVNPSNRWTIHIAEAIPNSYYTIYVGGVQKASFLTGDNIDATSAVESTSKIAEELYDDFVAAGYTATRYSSTIALEVPSGERVEIYEEGRAGKSMKVFSTAVDDFSDLPPHEETGRLVRIAGDLEESGDDYYVRFTDEEIWVETYGYGEGMELDAATMPHTLVYDQGTDEFTFQEFEWEVRLCGDDNTSPAPTFVDKKINDIFVHQGRLGLLSDENVILSEANSYKNFWRTTVVQLLDSDPIDIAAVSGRVSILNHAVPYNRNLLLFSDRSQYLLDTGDILSPKTAVASYTTSYAATVYQKPVNVGSFVYFVDDSGDYLRLLEYYTDNNALTDNADDISIQIPEYVTGPIRLLRGSSRVNLLVIQGENRDELYLYKFALGADRKIQSSWGKWTFAGDVQYYDFVGSQLYAFVNYSDGLYLEKVSLDEDAVRSSTDFPICMDHSITLADCTVSYDAGSGLSTITTPYEYPSNVTLVTAPGASDAGIQFVLTHTSGKTYTVIGDVTGFTDAVVGIPVGFYWKLSTQFIREQKGAGTVVVQDGRLSLRYLSLYYRDTSAFDLKVTLQGGREYVYSFEGRTLGSPTNLLGGLSIETGKFRVPIMGENINTSIEIINDTPYHCTFTACEWTGQWRPHTGSRL